MAPRAYWKGHVRLSLVSFPVQLIPAIDSKERVTFHRVHKQSGQRVRYQSVLPDQGPVENEEIGKGYEYEKGRFVVIEDDEINKLKLESPAYPRYRPVRGFRRDTSPLLRETVLCSSGRRLRRGRIPRGAGRHAGDAEGCNRPNRA